MTVKELIRELQAADPEGSATVEVLDTDLSGKSDPSLGLNYGNSTFTSLCSLPRVRNEEFWKRIDNWPKIK